MEKNVRKFDLGRNLLLAVTTRQTGDRLEEVLSLQTTEQCLLHWGVCRAPEDPWLTPPAEIWPAGTRQVGEGAVQTPFSFQAGEARLLITIPPEHAFPFIVFVIFFPAIGYWANNSGRNYFIPLVPAVRPAPPETVPDDWTAPKQPAGQPDLAGLAAEIIQAEIGRHSWTLMHRFNLCHDLLDQVGDDVEGLALLFVWLRFSALRQLDWQRHYNTKPRELAHAQKRLTVKLAGLYRQGPPPSRELLRFMLSTVGRGGEGGQGQRIRDDILHIMHRHRIKEVSGHFMEEWHQKLHNNATPDDIVICEAYLAFLRSNGDLSVFYRTLEQGGVSRQRLEGFERPIRTVPDFIPYLKDGLIHDFSNYLKLLKSIHSATDLMSAADHSLHCLGDDRLRAELIAIREQRAGVAGSALQQVAAITRLRAGLKNLLQNGPEAQCLRELLYLDLALEEHLRTVVEKHLQQLTGLEELASLIALLIDNVRFSHEQIELELCASHWQRLIQPGARGRQWAMHARAVLDRLSRVLAAIGDYYHRLLQARAEQLGQAFHAEPWAIELFSQEIIRSGAAFVLSLLLTRIDPLLRRLGRMGAWQVMSAKAAAQGCVRVAALSEIQDQTFSRPAIVVSERVTGDEEVPAGVVAILTPMAVDILSHLAVRTRNRGCLFAVCHEPKIMDELKALAGKELRLAVNRAGEVELSKVKGKEASAAAARPKGRAAVQSPRARPAVFSRWALAMTEFAEQQVGAKSFQLRNLAEKLPAWIHLPASVAIPFGACEAVLADAANQETRQRCEELAGRAGQDPAAVLPELRAALLDLEAPAGLITELRQVMTAAGLPWPTDWQTLWRRIKQVWASKWNERAFRSRRLWGLADSELFMAVLVQQVVEAQYSFVIHTVNPFTGAGDELYAEVAAGLGEVICSGNYPGRALSFTCRKAETLKPEILSFPGKHVAIRGSGLILRSDSNGEDLQEYAGAGLYDSVLLAEPRAELLDYTADPLLWDARFRKELMEKITCIGMEVEAAMAGQPQDIEGAWEHNRCHVVQTRPQAGAGR